MGVIKRQGIKNVFITYFGIVIGFLSLLFIQPHLLSASELGLIRILISFSGFIATMFPLGVSNVNVRYFPFFKNAEKKHHGYFGLMLLFPLVGCLIGGIFLYLLKGMIIQQYIRESKLFTNYFDFVFPLAVLITFILALNTYAVALLKTTIPSFFNDVVNRLMFVCVIFLYYFKVVDFSQFVFLFVLIYAVQLLLMLGYIYWFDTPGLLIDLKFLKKINVKQMVVYGLLLMLTSMSSISLKYLDSIMIAKYMPLAFVGIYSIAAFISTIIETPLVSLERIATAKVAHLWAAGNREEIKKIYYSSSKYMSLLGGFLLVGVWCNAKDLLYLLPTEYHQGVNVTLIMSVGAFINMATGVNYSILFNSSKYIYGVAFIVVLLSMTIVGNMVMIPRYGIEGAAIATAFASVIYNVLKYFYLWFEFKMQPFNISMVKILGVMALCFGVNYFISDIENHVLSIFIRSSLITIIYAASTYVLKIVPEFHQYIPILGKNKVLK